MTKNKTPRRPAFRAAGIAVLLGLGLAASSLFFQSLNVPSGEVGPELRQLQGIHRPSLQSPRQPGPARHRCERHLLDAAQGQQKILSSADCRWASLPAAAGGAASSWAFWARGADSSLSGITVAGLGAGAGDDVKGVALALGGVGAGEDLAGIAVGGLWRGCRGEHHRVLPRRSRRRVPAGTIEGDRHRRPGGRCGEDITGLALGGLRGRMRRGPDRDRRRRARRGLRRTPTGLVIGGLAAGAPDIRGVAIGGLGVGG